MIRGALIGLLTSLLILQGVALRAAPFVDPAAGQGFVVHLCSGGTVELDADGAPTAGDPGHEDASHLGCLDCCIAPIALPEPGARAPAREADPERAAPLPEAPAPAGHASPLACARDPPDAS
ncbi:hypothetical protein [Albimonas pacifica]|uniref:DUF2946 domain-containing protein n=1 Tax=Albimonas pacifica TaxID=1114924 RepID=A0A1I3F9F5_9RHOB|nr:hypothetical protein [Albimonas pacifica]SFI07770.1 hypothetical protein SAMN05216258_104137 [Albimonas pacifica]